MPMFNNGLSPLQKALQQSGDATGFSAAAEVERSNAQRENALPNPLAGVGMFSNRSRQDLQAGMTGALTGQLQAPQSAKLGSQFGRQPGNPWEAFIAGQDSAEDMMGNGQGHDMSMQPKTKTTSGIAGFLS